MAAAHIPRPLTCRVSTAENQVVVDVRGELDVATAPALLRELRPTFRLPLSSITLNLEHLSFIDSCGAQTLLSIERVASNAGIEFSMASVPANVRQVLDLTGLSERFTTSERRAR